MRRPIIFLSASAALAIAVFTTPQTDAFHIREWLYSDYLRTSLSANHDDACQTQNTNQHVCVEWCDVYSGGHIEPQGSLCCTTDPNDPPRNIWTCSTPLN